MTETQSLKAISGRATGVLFFAGFGSLWLGTGLAAMHKFNFVTGVLVGVVLGSLVIPAVLLLKRIPETSTDGAESDDKISKTFNRVNIIQWVGVAIAVILLNMFHKGEYIVPAIATIVGLHLFPLAKLFRYPAHYVTGALLVLWSAGTVILLAKERIASIGALGTAAILLGSATFTLMTVRKAARVVLGSSAFSTAVKS